jgi:hypothetical protein
VVEIRRQVEVGKRLRYDRYENKSEGYREGREGEVCWER